MLVAIITRIRYFGGGLGRMPSTRRTYRLTKPRGFFRPDSSVEQRLQRAHRRRRHRPCPRGMTGPSAAAPAARRLSHRRAGLSCERAGPRGT